MTNTIPVCDMSPLQWFDHCIERLNHWETQPNYGDPLVRSMIATWTVERSRAYIDLGKADRQTLTARMVAKRDAAPTYSLYFCNPAEHVGNFTSLASAIDRLSPDYCQYIIEHKPNDNGKGSTCKVVWSNARDNPRMMTGYTYTI